MGISAANGVGQGAMSVSLCVLTHNRESSIRSAVASAAEQGLDEIVVLDQASSPAIAPIPGVVWLRLEENLGVAGGRNVLASKATGDILLFMDDDATLLGTGAATALRRAFAADDRLAVVALHVQRHDGTVVNHEFPFRGRPRAIGRSRECGYFVGCGAAIRRSAFLSVGGFDPRYRYSTEELDLSFALIRSGWRLLYLPEVRIEHRPAEAGRLEGADVAALRWRNRLLLARRHLPIAFSVPHVAAWGARTLLEARRAGSLGPWMHATRQAFRLPIRRNPLGLRSALSVHLRGGRSLW
jgi:GT2 family glycosyltransferase